MNLRTWLLRNPRPSMVRVQTSEGDSHDLAIEPNVSWVSVAQSVDALSPERVEAYDQNGKLLRAITADDLSDAPGETEAIAQPRTPLNQAFLSNDPETQRFLAIAQMLADAHRYTTEVAFERMIGLFEAVNRRSEALERSLEHTHKLLRRAWEDQLEAAAEKSANGGEGDLLSTMAGSFMSGLGGVAGSGSSPTNGKAKA